MCGAITWGIVVTLRAPSTATLVLPDDERV